MSLPSQITKRITDHSAIVIAALLVTTAVLGAGIPLIDDDSSLEQFESDAPEIEAADYIDEHFAGETTEDAAMTSVQVIARGENVLSQAALVDALALQEAMLADEAIRPHLGDERPMFGIENLVGTAAVDLQGDLGDGDPTVAQQRAALAALDAATFEALLEGILTGDDATAEAAIGLLPADYDPGTLSAEARMTTITMVGQSADPQTGFDEAVLDAQLDIRELAAAHDESYLVFGAGIIFHELDQSMIDSLAIVGPFALLFVVLALAIAYRDLVDILLGFVGIILVLIWTFGFMGWMDIAFNQMMIAVPVLLIGLSIDYAIHVFMRHREQRAADNGATTTGGAMQIALAGVGVALLWVTATMVIGFLANLASPIDALGEFGVASAFGIVAALVIFGALIPAMKLNVDGLLERFGFDRRKRAFGTGGGRLSRGLTAGVTAARRAPLVTVALVALVTAGGILGATAIDTSFDQEDFLTEEPPAWTSYLPAFMQPTASGVSEDLAFINEQFVRDDFQGQILIRGDLTHPETFVQLQTLHEAAADSDTVFQRSDGNPAIESPLSLLHEAAVADEAFAALVAEHDTTGDQLPDEDLETVLDALYEAHPDAPDVLYRADDGSYESMQAVIAIRGDVDFGDAADALRGFASAFTAEGADWRVTATGDPVIGDVVESDLLDTVIQTLVLTLGAVFVFLTLAYWLTGNTVSLGLVTVTPVLIAVSWILGSMYLLDIPFNILTGMITSLTIGLGVAYSIHVSSRYTLELRRQEDMWAALETTVTGTGGALFGSAATTIGAFGTLSLATFPVLQQFGIVTGLTILYAFIASVFVLPVLLVLWTRYQRPDGFRATTPASTDE